MSQFLLPCPQCNTEIQVAKSQAGMSIVCPQCAANVQVPTIRGLSQLEPVTETAPRKESKSGPSWLVGLLASALMLTSVGCLGYGGYLYWYRSRINDPLDRTEEDFLEDIRLSMANISPAEAWDAWNEVSTSGITNMPLPQYFIWKRTFEIQRPVMIRCLTIGSLSLLGFGACLIFSRKRKT